MLGEFSKPRKAEKHGHQTRKLFYHHWDEVGRAEHECCKLSRIPASKIPLKEEIIYFKLVLSNK